MGIIELGSVPTPPKKPRSSTSTQSARQSSVPTATPIRMSRRLPLRKQAPTPTSSTTTRKLTSHPWPAWNAPNDRTDDENTEGWET